MFVGVFVFVVCVGIVLVDLCIDYLFIELGKVCVIYVV